MILTLAFRHLWVKKLRAVLLLVGYGLGVGVMIVLLSVGQAMVEQSRDVSLVGGGEVTVLPQGVDVEAMRTGGVSGMFFGIDRARFLTRVLLGGARQEGVVEAVSPLIERKLIYVASARDTAAVRAGGEVPSRARAVGAPISVLAGRWEDTPADSAWVSPTTGQLYDQLDRFHLPPRPDSTWAEWHYFNLVTAPDEWWYITYLVSGTEAPDRWRGRLLVTHRRPNGVHDRYSGSVPDEAVRFDTAGADLSLGPDSVTQRDGVYRLVGGAGGEAGRVSFELEVAPEPNRYFPPFDFPGDQAAGYVVPALSATARGRICVGGRCRLLNGVPAYHDHNWGIWRQVTWEWGSGRGQVYNLLYGTVHPPEDSLRTGSGALLVTLVDSLGVAQVFRAPTIRYTGPGGRSLRPGEEPAGFRFTASRDADSVDVAVTVVDLARTDRTAAGPGWRFLQMRGEFTLSGRLAGQPLADQGTGFFETYIRRR